jgi:hypothetical protein
MNFNRTTVDRALAGAAFVGLLMAIGIAVAQHRYEALSFGALGFWLLNGLP